MCVQDEAKLACERRRLGHEVLCHRERRAGGDGDLDTSASALLVQLADEPPRVGQHRVDLLDELVRREPSAGDAEVHRAARRHDAHAELPRCLHFRLDQPVASAWEHVVVVENHRASRQCELREPGSRRRVLGLGVDPGPYWVQLSKP